MADPAAAFDAALADVLAQFGRRMVDRPDQLRGALSDTLGASANEHRSEIDGAVAASRAGVASEIRDADPTVAASPEQIRAWFDQLVAVGVTLRDAALATRAWAQVFDASETARVTSQISSQLLGQDAEGAESSVGRVYSGPAPAGAEPSPATKEGAAVAASLVRGAHRDEDSTDLGDGSVLDRNDLDRTSVPTEASVATAESHQAVSEDSPATAPRERRGVGDERSWWRRWRVALASGAAVVIALAVAVPVIAAGVAPPFQPVDTSTPVDGLDVDVSVPLLAVGEIMPYTLSAEETSAIGDEYSSPSWAEDPTYGNAPEPIEPAACAAVDKAISDGGSTTYTSLATIEGDDDEYAFLNSVSRQYESAAAAQAAFDTLAVDAGSCKAAYTVYDWGRWEFSVTQERSELDDGTQVLHHVLTSTPTWSEERSCYLRLNVVSCITASGRLSILPADFVGESLADSLNARVLAIPLPWEAER